MNPLKRFWLLALYHWNELMLWQASIEADNAAKIVAEAEAEINRAISLAAQNNRKMAEARERLMISGFRVQRYDRLLSLGVKP